MEGITIDNEHPAAHQIDGIGTGVDAMAGMTTGRRAGRRDGREPGEIRNRSATQGVLTAADGSARVRMGSTDVIVAVYGPMDCPIPRQLPDRVQVHVSYRKREGASGGGTGESVAAGREAIAARDLRQLVMEVVVASMHPRKAVFVAVQVLADSGSMAAAAVNASVLALVDAGVPMQAVPSAASVSVHSGALLVDPVSVEEAEADAILTFVFDTNRLSERGFMSVYTEGDCGGEDLFTAAAEVCREVATKTRAFLKLGLTEKSKFPYAWNPSPS